MLQNCMPVSIEPAPRLPEAPPQPRSRTSATRSIPSRATRTGCAPAPVRGQRTLGEDVADGKAVTAYAISEVEMLDEAQGRSSDVSGALGQGRALAPAAGRLRGSAASHDESGDAAEKVSGGVSVLDCVSPSLHESAHDRASGVSVRAIDDHGVPVEVETR